MNVTECFYIRAIKFHLYVLDHIYKNFKVKGNRYSCLCVPKHQDMKAYIRRGGKAPMHSTPRQWMSWVIVKPVQPWTESCLVPSSVLVHCPGTSSEDSDVKQRQWLIKINKTLLKGKVVSVLN
jgi:hypothetical protein